jgi:hypothetical protein
MPDEPKANGSGTHETAAIVTAVAPPPAEPFFEDDDDLSEDLLDPVDDDDDEEEQGAEPFALDFSVPEEDEDDFDDLDDDDDDVFPAAAPEAGDDRIAKLEAAARDLAASDVDRHNRRVRRKVSAATTGAGASGVIPVLLSLVGVYDLDPAVTAALSTAASLIGAFVVGYFTPERRPSLDEATAHQILNLGS